MFNKINNPIVIRNDSFRKCCLVITYPIKNYKDEYLIILNDVVCDKSVKYNTDKKKYLTIIDNYLLSCNGRVLFLGDSPFLEFRMSFPSYNSLGVDVLKDNLLFIKDIIYNALLFDNDRINDIKSIIKGNINKRFKDAIWYYDYANKKIIDEDNFLVNRVILNPNLLDNVNSDNLYEFYKSIINDPPFVFFTGDVIDDAENVIKDVFLDGNTTNIMFEKKYNHYCKYVDNNVKITREKTNFKTSSVYYTYKVSDMLSDRDKVLLLITNNLISSNESDVLFDILRTKNNLVYRCDSIYYRNFGCLIIKSFTSKENIDMVCSLYNSVMDKISDSSYISEKLSLFIKKMETQKKLEKERIWDSLFTYIDKFLEYDIDNNLDIMREITPDEVSYFIKNRLILTNIYIGEGVLNE
ncbi:MAG: insulinase family protein [Bacilli bacterium]